MARQVLVAGRGDTPGRQRRLVAVAIGPAAAPTAALAAQVPAGRSGDALLLLIEASGLGLRARAPGAAGVRRAGGGGRDRRGRAAACSIFTRPPTARFRVAAALLSDLRLFAAQLESELTAHRQPRCLSVASRTSSFGRWRSLAVRELARSAGAPPPWPSRFETCSAPRRALADATGAEVEVE